MTDVRRLFTAMDRRDHRGIFEALTGTPHPIPSAVERGAGSRACFGCSHPAHPTNGCRATPLFTREGRCRCWYEQ